MKLNSFSTVVIVIAACAFPAILNAAPGDPGPGPIGAPLDGGIGLMIAAGVAYASKKAYDKRKADKNNSVSDR